MALLMALMIGSLSGCIYIYDGNQNQDTSYRVYIDQMDATTFMDLWEGHIKDGFYIINTTKNDPRTTIRRLGLSISSKRWNEKQIKKWLKDLGFDEDGIDDVMTYVKEEEHMYMFYRSGNQVFMFLK